MSQDDATNETQKALPRRSSTRWWLLAVPLAALLGVSAVARAGMGGPWGHRGGMGEFMAFRMHRVLEAAGATDAQKAQIKSTWQALRPQFQALRADQEKLHQQLRQALTAPTVDPNQIEQLRKQSLQLVDRGSALVSQGLVSTAQVLTPEQRQKVAAQLAEHHHGGHGQDPGTGK